MVCKYYCTAECNMLLLADVALGLRGGLQLHLGVDDRLLQRPAGLAELALDLPLERPVLLLGPGGERGELLPQLPLRARRGLLDAHLGILHLYINIYIYIYIYTHTLIHTHIHIHIHMYVYIYVYAYDICIT